MEIFCRTESPCIPGKNPTFQGIFDRFSTGGMRLSQGFPRSFPHPAEHGKILLYRNTFSCFPLYGGNLSTDFSTTCGKLSSKVLRACHTCPHFWGQATTFQRQNHDIFSFSTCHTDKMPRKQGILPYFFHFFTGKIGFLAFPHEFSTVCGKTCGKLLWTIFDRIRKVLDRLENLTFQRFFGTREGLKYPDSRRTWRSPR